MSVDALRAVPAFAGLSEATLRRMEAASSETEFRAGQVMIELNAPGSGLFVIIEGTALVHARDGDHEVGPGGIVGELALLRPDGIRSARVTASTRVRCLSISRDAFDDLVAADPDLAARLT